MTGTPTPLTDAVVHGREGWAKARTLERRLAQLEQAVEDAPHDEVCARRVGLRLGAGLVDCDCWKSRVARGVGDETV